MGNHKLTVLVLLAFFACGVQAFAQTGNLARFERAKESFRTGYNHFNNMRYLAAVEFFRKALSEYPDYHTAREYLARSYRLAGFRDEALAEWEQLSAENPDNVLVRNKIDSLRFREGGKDDPLNIGEYLLADEIVSREMKQYRFINPVDAAVDDDRNIYITSFSAGKLIKIDPNKNGISVFSPAIGSRLYGLDYHRNSLLVTDFKKDTVYVLNTALRIQKSFGGTGNEEGKFHGPQGACFDPKGNIYVVDSGNDRVQKFDHTGRFILSFGKSGEYEGHLSNPTDCAATADMVYITDTGNNRISAFDDSGNYIDVITMENAQKLRNLSLRGKTLLVSDEKKGLFFYDLDRKEQALFSSWEGGKKEFGSLYSSIAGRDEFMYCLDYRQEKLLIFSPLRQRYANLDIEISMVDTKKFPVVALYVNIKDRTGRPVYGLKRENFSLTEDGAKIFGLYSDYLKRKNPSASMVLCVDRSVGMRGYHNDIPWAAEFILKKMRKDDSLKILGFNSDYWTDNEFDWSRRRALKALHAGHYAAGKDMGRVLYNAVADLVPRTNRRGVIMITSGEVSESSFTRYSVKNVIEFARSHYIPIYIVSFRGKDPLLRKIALQTGGDIYTARQADDLRKIYGRIRNSEEYRYVLVYSTFKTKTVRGWWADVRINVDNRGLKGTEWGGYFVP